MIDPRNWSPGKMVLALLGAFFLAAAVFQGLGSLASREPGTPKKKGIETSSTREPLRPTLERVDDWTILIREGHWHRSRFRFNESDGLEKVDALYACFEESIARAFDDNPTTKQSELTSRMKEIRDRCSLGALRVPPVPPVPEP